jgi:hypothetical protein
MPLQNRINPYGEICFSKERGNNMGNRGCLHNGDQKIVKHHQLKRWIICLLEFKTYYRKVMTKGRYTELFFWDEATAFAAGHRPCAECQRSRFVEFRNKWREANEQPTLSTEEMDNFLHDERFSENKIWQSIDELPDGVFVELVDKSYLVKDKKLYEWTFGGYSKSGTTTTEHKLKVLTPYSLVKTFQNGFEPHIIWGDV